MESYTELIVMLDRAKNHREALTKAIQRGHTLAKLKITMVINKEDPQFVAAWERAIKKCETSLVKIITDHLGLHHRKR